MRPEMPLVSTKQPRNRASVPFYRLQYNSDMSSTNWTDLGGSRTAAATTLSATDPATNGPARFYRVMRLP
jgi:hypothetical protein